MSMPSRSRTGSGALVAGLIILVTIVVALAILAAAGVTPQSFWNSFFPVQGQTPVTDRSLATKALYDIVFYIAAAIFVLVELLIIFTVFRYRRKPGDDSLPPQTHGNNLVEVIWTAIPTAIVLFLFVLSFQALQKVDATTTPELHVRAVAARFQWRFDYLDDSGQKVVYSESLPTGEGGGLVLPVGEPVKITLISPDVIHAFYVPKFLFKRDVVPGKENTFEFTVEEPGTYSGQCAELCGTYHDAMLFEVHAKPRSEFDSWLKAKVEKANATPAPAASGAASGPKVDLSAKNVAYSTNALQAPANTAFTLHFKNEDAGIPHNVQIKDAAGKDVFKGDIITGASEIDYAVPSLAAGTYPFVCTVHPNMTGTLTVQ